MNIRCLAASETHFPRNRNTNTIRTSSATARLSLPGQGRYKFHEYKYILKACSPSKLNPHVELYLIFLYYLLLKQACSVQASRLLCINPCDQIINKYNQACRSIGLHNRKIAYNYRYCFLQVLRMVSAPWQHLCVPQQQPKSGNSIGDIRHIHSYILMRTFIQLYFCSNYTPAYSHSANVIVSAETISGINDVISLRGTRFLILQS